MQESTLTNSISGVKVYNRQIRDFSQKKGISYI